MRFSRRDVVKAGGLSLLGASLSGWGPMLARALTESPERRQCILLWMNGGPSQIDTFDLKPGHENGGEFKETETSVPGLKFSEHLPQLAQQADELAVLRSVTTKEGDHGRGAFLVRTGHMPGGPLRYPPIGASLAKQLGNEDDPLPAYVSISPHRAFSQAAYSSGFLGPKYAALTVGASDVFQATARGAAADAYAQLRVDDLLPPDGVSAQQAHARFELWETLQQGFLERRQSPAPVAHDTVYRRAARLVDSSAAKAFDLEGEPASVRDAYGKGRFGQGCLMARRLIERGVAFVEVTLGAFGGGSLGWDTHANNFAVVKNLSAELDAGWATLMRELSERGLLETTTVVWMGEFGRTPKINRRGGRDHFPAAWSAVLAGGGVRGGQAYGKTSDDGMEVAEHPIAISNLLATVCQAVGVAPETQNISELGRPIRVAEGTPIRQVLA